MPLKRITDNVRQLGWTNGLLYLAHRALSALSGGRARIVRYYLVAQPVLERSPNNLRPSAGNPVTFVSPDDPLTASFPRPPGVIARRFANNDLCIAARSGERFAGFLWIARGRYAEDEVRCLYHLADARSSAWDYDVYVEPDFRIGRTFARLWDKANQYLRSEGVEWSFSRISAFNPGSLQAHGKLGIRVLFSASFLCLGPMQVMIAGYRPYVHVSLSARSGPTLQLSIPEKP
jgi:hypothetical protein